MKFICNDLGKISQGDAYEITFNSPEDLTYFVLTEKFALIPETKVKEFITTKLKKLKYI